MSPSVSTSGPYSWKLRPATSLRVRQRTKASATSRTATGANRAPAQASGRKPGTMRRIDANLFTNWSSGPNTTDGWKITNSGLPAAHSRRM